MRQLCEERQRDPVQRSSASLCHSGTGQFSALYVYEVFFKDFTPPSPSLPSLPSPAVLCDHGNPRGRCLHSRVSAEKQGSWWALRVRQLRDAILPLPFQPFLQGFKSPPSSLLTLPSLSFPPSQVYYLEAVNWHYSIDDFYEVHSMRGVYITTVVVEDSGDSLSASRRDVSGQCCPVTSTTVMC